MPEVRRVLRHLRAARENWGKNHKYQGGLGSLFRCWRGQRALERRVPAGPSDSIGGIEVLTFSVVPWLTALWGRSLQAALSAKGHRLLVGDCSGGFRGGWLPFVDRGPIRVLPCLNHHHGEKLDLFVSKVCSSELVMVCDDDIFWLRDEPLTWALERFAQDPTLAVVSLAPRTLISSALEGRVEEPMGSSCLLIRRSIWQREGCSFRMAPDPRGEDWFFDTCDRANVELLDRGFQIEIAPPEIRRGLVPLEAVSAWILKAQKHPPRRLAQIADLPIRRTKAFRALVTAHRLAHLAGRSVGDESRIGVLGRLEAAADTVAGCLEPAEQARIRGEVEDTLVPIEERLLGDPMQVSTNTTAEPSASAS